jgi:hypothetical protein
MSAILVISGKAYQTYLKHYVDADNHRSESSQNSGEYLDQFLLHTISWADSKKTHKLLVERSGLCYFVLESSGGLPIRSTSSLEEDKTLGYAD